MRRRRYMQGSGEPPAIYNETDAQFYYRQTSGGVIMDNSPLVGRFDKIKGNTIAWNQNIKNGNFSDGTNNWGANKVSATVQNGEVTIRPTTEAYNANNFYQVIPTITGHKYLISFYNKGNSTGIVYAVDNGGYSFAASQDFVKTRLIRTSNGYDTIRFYPATSGTLTDKYLVLKDIQLIDLTLIYGAGNEPSTPAQFEADYFKWFGKPLTYEPYDAGSLRSVKMGGIKSVGFNQWDEEWLSGYWNGNKGDNVSFVSASTIVCNKNPIKVLPNTTYRFTSPTMGRPDGATGYFNVRFVDINGVILETNGNGLNNTLTSPEGAAYLYFNISAFYGNTYNNDICINISDTNKNGTYETHWSETRNISITTLTGKVNGQGESVVVFPDGMLSAGNVHDEIYKQDGKTYAVKRVGRVDLGSLRWNKWNFSNSGLSTPSITDMKLLTESTTVAVGTCAKYIASVWNSGLDKMYFGPYDGSFGNQFIIKNSDYDTTTAEGRSAFVSALSGVYLNYELATPIIYELDGFTLPVSYNCIALGTEEILPENSSTPTSVAPIVDTAYRLGHINN